MTMRTGTIARNASARQHEQQDRTDDAAERSDSGASRRAVARRPRRARAR